MVHLDIMFAGVLIVALGIMLSIYMQFESRRGRFLFKPLSLKSNVKGNLLFGLIIVGVMTIILGGVIS